MTNFDNKVIWITGASSGIGEAFALYISQFNCKIILSARRETVLNTVKNKCQNPDNVHILPLDLYEHDQLGLKVEEALSAFGTIDLLVNNAGISQRSLIADTTYEVDKKLIDINYLGTITLSKALLPHFTQHKKGHFVVVTSLMGKFSSPYRSAYCGAKHALHGFFDALRLEHEKDNVKVTMICPGFVNTDVARNAFVGDGSKQKTQDTATENGLKPEVFAKRMVKAITNEKFEAYIGKKEVMAVYLKRFFPKLLHKITLKSQVR